ncbi:MAG: DHA2 family efflux MFS transporter permease subunit [Novosphingobium sp.]|nr:DHA2 family efflux MFS transporter permease subunit [Novosphingobium sp.]
MNAQQPGRPIFTPFRLWLSAIMLAFSNFIVVLDMTVANVSIPHIAGDLGVSMDQGTWIITTYAVAEALTVPLTGWLAQRFGALRLYVMCMAGFGLFSFLCGISTTLQMIVICRIGQGLCGGLVMPIAQTLLLRLFPREDIGKAMLLSSMTVMLGPAMGPTVGGFISDNFGWHWIFLINIPLVIGLIFFALTALRPLETSTRKVPVDVTGLFLMILWIGCLQLMLDLGRNRDWFADPLIVVLAVVAAVGFCAFLIWELTEEHPIVDIRVFRHGGFTFGVVALSLCFGGYFASIVVIPQWLQSSMGYPAVLAGFITSCTALTALVTSQFASKAVGRGIDPRLMVSLAVAWLGCMSLVRATWTNGSDFWHLAAPQLIQGLGMSFFILPLSIISIGAVDEDEIATATGIQNFVRTLFIGLSTATALTIWSDTQQEARNELASNLQPESTLETLTDAGFTAEQARGIISNLVEREAVVMAVDHVFLISAAVFFICAAVVWLAPRPKAPAGTP